MAINTAYEMSCKLGFALASAMDCLEDAVKLNELTRVDPQERDEMQRGILKLMQAYLWQTHKHSQALNTLLESHP